MASKRATYKGNTGGLQPLIALGKFKAGSNQEVKEGELLELSSGEFVPLSTDKAMAAIVAVAVETIKAGDRAGYYPILVPQPGDFFELPLDSAGNPDPGDSVYVEGSQELSLTGSNELGKVLTHDGMPQRQGHLTDDASVDAGTTVGSVSSVRFTINAAASYFRALQGA